jgi:4-amino-4-deoxy-L-arabinose transferase-like glycosyltransferase
MKSSRIPTASEILFWIIFLFAAVVRFKDLSTGLPLHTLYGETDTLEILLGMMKTGDLNPHQYDLPGLAYYFLHPFFYLFYLIGSWFGYFSNIDSVPTSSFIFVGRVVCAIFGTATVYLAYRMGKRFSTLTGLLAMAIMAAVPQHIEYSHMLRPEIPAIFFVLLAHEVAFSILRDAQLGLYWLFGLATGITISLKYTIGLPLILTLLAVHIIKRKEAKLSWLLRGLFVTAVVFFLTNPFLLTSDEAFNYWKNRVEVLYSTGEDYYGKSTIAYYVEFLTRYDYNVPLMVFAGFGILLSLTSSLPRGVLLSIYPISVFLWLSSFETRRTHGLLPLHPFVSLWAGITLAEVWRMTQEFSRKFVFKLAFALLLAVSLFWPYYRSGVQSYLFSRTDNRSKAELWMVNRLPRTSRIALLQYSQLELDPNYFQIEKFVPRDYVFNNKDFRWFRQNGFDYLVVSSGQYMRYFIEGQTAQKYKDYFIKLFRDGETEGTLILDLTPHPLLIPDYRIKVYATNPSRLPAGFFSAIEVETGEVTYSLARSGVTLSLEPGYYSLTVPKTVTGSSLVEVRNLKSDEMILRRRGGGDVSNFPFSVFPVRMNSRFRLFTSAPEIISPNQLVRFQWTTPTGGLVLEKIPPEVRVSSADFSPDPLGTNKPFLSFKQNAPFSIRTTLRNRGNTNVAGYIEAYLSQIGEAQPWKNFDVASSAHEFFLEPAQRITIDVPMNTRQLTGDYQLSYWIFTRRDLPFSPQNGGWFNRQIRVEDAKLGLHPIYDAQIP